MKFAYIRVQVGPPDPDRVMLLNSLMENTTGEPQPDVVPHCDPGGISFEHVILEAASEDDAYLRGYDLLPERLPNTVMNDYVIDLGSS